MSSVEIPEHRVDRLSSFLRGRTTELWYGSQSSNLLHLQAGYPRTVIRQLLNMFTGHITQPSEQPKSIYITFQSGPRLNISKLMNKLNHSLFVNLRCENRWWINVNIHRNMVTTINFYLNHTLIQTSNFKSTFIFLINAWYYNYFAFMYFPSMAWDKELD
jgi:hypothetical protein